MSERVEDAAVGHAEVWPYAWPAEEHCYVHRRREPRVGAFRVCFECGHVFLTSAALVIAHNVVLAALAGDGDGEEPEPLKLSEGDRVTICPECDHDF